MSSRVPRAATRAWMTPDTANSMVVFLLVLLLATCGGGRAQQSFSVAGPIVLADNDATTSSVFVDSTVNVVDGVAIKGLSHSWSADLDFYLDAPDGTIFKLAVGAGSSADYQDHNYAFVKPSTDDAIQFGNVPPDGTYQQFGIGLGDALLGNISQPMAPGTWRLRIEDTVSLDSGMFDSWSLSINGLISTAADWCALETVCGLCDSGQECLSPAAPVCTIHGCVECELDSQCSTACVNNACTECASDADCSVACVNYACVECAADSDCSGVCVNNACVECFFDADCPSGVCTADHSCVDCIVESDCNDPALTCRANTCEAVVCGDAARDGLEGCDDGNTEDGDGCSSSCTLELEFLSLTEVCAPGGVIPHFGEVSFPLEISTYVDSVFSVKIAGLEHTFSGDLDVYLEDPNNIRHLLFSGPSGSNDFEGQTYSFVGFWADMGAPAWPASGSIPQSDQTFRADDEDLEDVYAGSGTWKLVVDDKVFGDSGAVGEWCLGYNDPSTCSPADRAVCSEWATCNKTSGTATCKCKSGFEDVSGGSGTECVDVDECRVEELVDSCHYLAECHNYNGSFACVCPDGFIGNGTWCSSNAFSVRTVLTIPGVGNLKPPAVEQLKLAYAMVVTQDDKLGLNASIVQTLPVFRGAWQYGSRLLGILHDEGDGDTMTFFALFESEADARAAVSALGTPDWSLLGATSAPEGPEVYRWTGGSTSDPVEPPPTGLAVDAVWFEPACLQSGCWAVDVTYTAGIDDFNVFFLPRAEASDTLSYDPDYSTPDALWPVSPADTFLPANHPCTSLDFGAGESAGGGLPSTITACCLPQFLAMYRPVATFAAALDAIPDCDLSVCGAGPRDRPADRSTLPKFAARRQTPDPDANLFPAPASPSAVPGVFVDGVFAGMAASNIAHTQIADSYVGVYRARLLLDEVELRTLAGQLRGTVGVEHTVDTFVGLANFGLTGSAVLDSSAVQVNIHLEKTSYFSVSTHGTNDYTFLEYVNMRLVGVYNEDADFSGEGESADRSVRTAASDAAQYVQVTFTLGDKYEVDTGSGLIPLSSVRAGKGTFLSDVAAASGEAGMVHKCLQWTGDSLPGKAGFTSTLQQACAPGVAMCKSPAAIPDSFVSFNIPLGVDWLDGTQSETMSTNVFVDMVIAVVDNDARDGMTAPAEGEAPWQMKTSLTGSIPVVDGGINIFCDGITAKTDLKDVANADIIVGSAASATEMSRLRIKTDIASTQLAADAITEINSASIEEGLMTLVLKGDEGYFQSNTGVQGVSLELEDLISIHIMDADGSSADASVVASVMDLITAAPDDNSDSNGLVTEGYALNAAFFFEVDRSAQRAHLQPSPALLALCPFNPPRPSAGNMMLETCVLRRDVQHRDFPWRAGGSSSAMELCANVNANKQGAVCPTSTASLESQFLASVLGDSDYARQLALDFVQTIAEAYSLNGRFRRAFWINPGYEWTPVQTGGKSVFSLSQKLFLMALVTIDEGIVSSDAGRTITDLSSPGVGPHFARRMLLQSSSEGLLEAQAAVNADAFAFAVTPRSMLATAFEVPAERVASFEVQVQLTAAEACKSPAALQAALRQTFADYLSEAASTFLAVQVSQLAVDPGDVQCPQARRRSPRRLLSPWSSANAVAEMLVVFPDGRASKFNPAAFAELPGITSVQPSPSNSAAVQLDETFKCVSNCGERREPAASQPSGGSSIAIIAAAAGGACGAVALAVGGFLYLRSRREYAEAAATIQSIDVAGLKAQLQSEV